MGEVLNLSVCKTCFDKLLLTWHLNSRTRHAGLVPASRVIAGYFSVALCALRDNYQLRAIR